MINSVIFGFHTYPNPTKDMYQHAYLSLVLWLSCLCILQAQDLETALRSQTDIVVAQDGSGDFTTISAAVNSVPFNSSSRTVIFVRNGTYVEKLEIQSGINKVTLVGEDIDSTIIVYDDYSGSGELYDGIISSKVGDPIGTSTSHSMYIDSEDVIVMNFTIVNSAGDVGQAVAMNLGGDRTILVRCRILGNQDTFYTWGYGRFLMQDCFIEGDVDFIFGRGVAVFDSCIINTNRSSCQITAASTDAGWKFGYVFRNCRITANRGVSGVSMGRPWRENAQTVFMNCFLDKHISSRGWTDWDGRSATCYYAEYNNYGPGSDTSNRVDWSYQLSDAQAQSYTHANMFAKDVNPDNFGRDWDPGLQSDSVYMVLKEHTALLFSDTLQNNADLKSLNVYETPIEEFDPSDNYYVIELPDTTAVMPVISAEPLAPHANVSIEYPGSLPGNAQVSVTAINGFSLTYTVRFEVATGLESGIFEPPLVQVLGNPVSDHLRIRITGISGPVPLVVSLYAVNGTLAGTQTFSSYMEGSELAIDTSSLLPGMYLCRITAGSGMLLEKIIKQSD